MTTAEAHQIAQQNPLKTQTTRLGELKAQADQQIANLTMTLKQLDDTKAVLDELGLTMTVDLGPIGNAAQHARRAQLDDEGARTFALPKAEAYETRLLREMRAEGLGA